MNHGNQHRKLNRTSAHREAMFANMACSLIKHRRIKTTLPKAKEIRPIVERLVTIGKAGQLADLRSLISRLHDVESATILFKELAPAYKERHGGYLRIMKCGFRKGDSAPIAIIEFVDNDQDSSKTAKKAIKSKATSVKKAADASVKTTNTTSKATTESKATAGATVAATQGTAMTQTVVADVAEAEVEGAEAIEAEGDRS